MNKNNKIINLCIPLLFVLLGCHCDTIKEKHCDIIKEKLFYKNGNIKIITTKNCNNEILKYEHYTEDGELAFSMDYKNSQPQEPYEGLPWVHLIWNNMKPFIGDSINLEVDLVTPPQLEIKFSIEDNESTHEFPKKDKYFYSKIAKDTIENIKLKAIFLLNNKKWVTAKRSILLKCTPRKKQVRA